MNAYSDEDLNYRDETSRVSREHEDESLRDNELVQTTPDGFAGYDTVLVGYPIWWGIAAWPLNRFVSDNGFDGKRVITFCTSASSGMGESSTLLAELAGTGEWAEGTRFSSNSPEEEIRSWVRSLGAGAL